MAFETPDDYRIKVELNQAILDEELRAIAELSQGAAANAWEEILALPEDQQRLAIRRSLDAITREHGRSAMVAARDNMEAHVTMWAKERHSYAGLPDKIQYTRPLGDDRLDKYADDVYKRLHENGEKDASDAFSRLIANTINNRARNVVVNTCRKAHTRFYRVPERRACWFCLMLASRGAVYYSAYTAGRGHRYHAHCRCTVRAALPGEEPHPLVKHLTDNYGFGNTAVWQAKAESGALQSALEPYGYELYLAS